jgi:hypothetical protein
MKALKLTGRERAVLRHIDETSGSTGTEIQAQAHIDEPDLVDVLNGMINAGFVEAFAPGETLIYVQEISLSTMSTTRFEVNPAYAAILRQASRRNY